MQNYFFALSILLLLLAIGLYHRFYLKGGNIKKLEAVLKKEEMKRLSMRDLRDYQDMLFWSNRIMNMLHKVKSYQELCSCQALLANFKSYFKDMPQAKAEWEAIEVVFTIKKETVRRNEELIPVPIRYTEE